MGRSKVNTREIEVVKNLMRQIDAPMRVALRRESQVWAPSLRWAVGARARGKVERKIASSTTTRLVRLGLKVVVGGSGRLSGGAKLAEVTRPYEFGTTRQNVKRTVAGDSGRPYKRRTMRQIPSAAPDGHFVYQGLADALPVLVSNYVRAVARVLDNA